MSHTGNESGIDDAIDGGPIVGKEADAALSIDAAPRACENCGATLLGDHCYACGQPVKGLVRHFSSILGDFFDTVLNIDARVFRTLWPLFGRPGFLSREYFAGRRVRYVSPVRLFFFLSIVTFFIAQLATDVSNGDGLKSSTRDNNALASATTVAEVTRIRDTSIAGLARGRQEAQGVPGVDAGLRGAETAIRATAAVRIEALRKAEARGEPPPPPAQDGLTFGNGTWDAKDNPISIPWLPRFANDWLNAQAGRANSNIARIKQDPNLFKDALLSAVPTMLFVLLPVFALMLKLAYLFRKRLYMEHLIVALHSHAFLSLMLLLVFLTLSLHSWAAPGPGALNSAFGWLEAAMWIWMPLYLLLMQKRVYGQGWPMTLLKYGVLGVCYLVLLGFGAVFIVLSSLVWM